MIIFKKYVLDIDRIPCLAHYILSFTFLYKYSLLRLRSKFSSQSRNTFAVKENREKKQVTSKRYTFGLLKPIKNG